MKSSEKEAERILEEVKISVLRGNMSEAKFIAGLESETKGVDASEEDLNSDNDQGIKVAKALSQRSAKSPPPSLVLLALGIGVCPRP